MEQSIRAAGAAAPHLHGERRPAIHVRLDETFLEQVRRTLGADAWQAAAQQGAALSFRAAVAYALDERPADPAAAPFRGGPWPVGRRGEAVA
jgi:hypothetical protein